jgi:hydrogenase-4 component H
VLDAGSCDGGGACAAVCPSGAIAIEASAGGDKKFSLDYGACVFCGRCVDVCGARALAQSGEYMLSVSHRADLVFTTMILSGVDTGE